MRLVSDPQAADWEEIRAAAKWRSGATFAKFSHQWCYEHIPRQVIVERFLGDPSDGQPADYKFFVFGGSVEVIQVHLDRFGRHQRDLYTPEWERIDVWFGHPRGSGSLPHPRPPPPRHLKEMLEAATLLSK